LSKTEAVGVSTDFGFWILDWLGLQRTELEIRQNFLMIPLERLALSLSMEGGLKPLFFGQHYRSTRLSLSFERCFNRAKKVQIKRLKTETVLKSALYLAELGEATSPQVDTT